MTSAVLADTGPLYAAADVDDAYHPRARRELKALVRENREVLLAYPTFCEAYTLVLHRLGKTAVERWSGEVMSGVSLLNPLPQDYQEAVKRLKSFADLTITMFDATVAVLGSRLGVPIWTYDHHFHILGASVWR